MQVEELLRQGGGPPPPGFQMRREDNPGSGGGGGGGAPGKRQPRVRLKLKYPAGRYPSKRVIEKFGPFEMPGIDVGIGLGGGPKRRRAERQGARSVQRGDARAAQAQGRGALQRPR